MCLAHKNAKLLGVFPKCVASTKKRYEETGTVSDRSRSGRPRKLTLRDKNYIFREIRKDPTSSYQKLATDFNSRTQAVRISKSSFLTAQLKLSIMYSITKRGPGLYLTWKLDTAVTVSESFGEILAICDCGL
ncbi:hypothetical protein BpHYR1_045906 [Brachionus plicatilis]|uniref:Uncharacterized protein n=1 Tax=Brachionus plicatilis TaxID=10195 RepID=A0A3M7S788_BRAPC|nr:hypothetical protein BpHYR1_045906 [Brachionus plicatilis]